MIQLTDRQITILKAIIEEYIETAEPVGSETLDKKYSLGVSPATIRNEMVRLTEQEMLRQPHTSAGRIPTAMAFKYYIQNLMQQKAIPVSDEVALKQKIWDYRERANQTLQAACRILSEKTKSLAVATTSEGDVYYAGAAHLIEAFELFDLVMTKHLLRILDEAEFWQNMFVSRSNASFHVLFGEDLKEQFLSQCGIVYTVVHTPRMDMSIGVLGPTRLPFSSVIPTVSYMGSLLEQVSKSW